MAGIESLPDFDATTLQLAGSGTSEGVPWNVYDAAASDGGVLCKVSVGEKQYEILRYVDGPLRPDQMFAMVSTNRGRLTATAKLLSWLVIECDAKVVKLVVHWDDKKVVEVIPAVSKQTGQGWVVQAYTDARRPAYIEALDQAGRTLGERTALG